MDLPVCLTRRTSQRDEAEKHMACLMRVGSQRESIEFPQRQSPSNGDPADISQIPWVNSTNRWMDSQYLVDSIYYLKP